jgi:hypothetical protein
MYKKPYMLELTQRHVDGWEMQIVNFKTMEINGDFIDVTDTP